MNGRLARLRAVMERGFEDAELLSFPSVST